MKLIVYESEIECTYSKENRAEFDVPQVWVGYYISRLGHPLSLSVTFHKQDWNILDL